MQKRQVHFILQGKGGVGKSFISALLVQFLANAQKQQAGSRVLVVDTDPVNRTISRYTQFDAIKLELLNDAQTIDTRRFDELIELIIDHDGPTVVDNGASTFVPLMAYLAENKVVDLLIAQGMDVVIHVPITGGQAIDDTLSGFDYVVKVQAAPVVVWKNAFFGEITRDGLQFEQTKIYQSAARRVLGVISLHKRTEDTYGRDIGSMIARHLTFDEAIDSTQHFAFMARNRLHEVRNDVYGQLAGLQL
jgi:hypothetical protein